MTLGSRVIGGWHSAAGPGAGLHHVPLCCSHDARRESRHAMAWRGRGGAGVRVPYHGVVVTGRDTRGPRQAHHLRGVRATGGGAGTDARGVTRVPRLRRGGSEEARALACAGQRAAHRRHGGLQHRVACAGRAVEGADRGSEGDGGLLMKRPGAVDELGLALAASPRRGGLGAAPV